jgi:two-component system, OmpR family, sensor kinase
VSLRARLTLGLVVLAAIGLGVAGFATHGALHRFLFDRVDEQLSAALRRPAVSARAVVLPAGGYYEVRRPDGSVVRRQDAFLVDAAPPDLPDTLPLGAFTVDASSGDARYRVASERLGNGGTLVIALPLDEVQRTLRRLVAVEVVVALVVLAGLALLGWWLIGVGLRPLERMGRTANAIAAGDLSQRVEPATATTEVGRLGLALNTMLEQIEQAFTERQASEARLRQFAADASHELRTPLTSIRGYAELFRRGADQHPDDLAKAMRRIEDEATRMGVLVDDLLLLARLDQGRPPARASVDVTRLAHDAVDDARAAHPRHDVTLTTNGSVALIGDEQQLRQVVGNLLTNACTHTPDGTPVRVVVRPDDGDALIEVSDEGPGLTDVERQHVFEQFWRADAARQRVTGGAGLGLSIVQAIASAHGGSASVDSTPGHGATFRVRIPMR